MNCYNKEDAKADSDHVLIVCKTDKGVKVLFNKRAKPKEDDIFYFTKTENCKKLPPNTKVIVESDYLVIK